MTMQMVYRIFFLGLKMCMPSSLYTKEQKPKNKKIRNLKNLSCPKKTFQHQCQLLALLFLKGSRLCIIYSS